MCPHANPRLTVGLCLWHTGSPWISSYRLAGCRCVRGLARVKTPHPASKGDPPADSSALLLRLESTAMSFNWLRLETHLQCLSCNVGPSCGLVRVGSDGTGLGFSKHNFEKPQHPRVHFLKVLSLPAVLLRRLGEVPGSSQQPCEVGWTETFSQRWQCC